MVVNVDKVIEEEVEGEKDPGDALAFEEEEEEEKKEEEEEKKQPIEPLTPDASG